MESSTPKNNAFLTSLRQLTIELEERTLGAFHTIQQQSFDRKAQELAVVQAERQSNATKTGKKTTAILSSSHNVPTKFEIRALFHLWNHALANRDDASLLASRYADAAAVLTPHDLDTYTLNSVGEIQEYYHQALFHNNNHHQNISCRIVEGRITVSEHVATDTGILEMKMQSKAGRIPTTTTTQVRYSFTYINQQGKWKIQSQHMSVMPSAMSSNLSDETVGDKVDTTNTNTTTSKASSGTTITE